MFADGQTSLMALSSNGRRATVVMEAKCQAHLEEGFIVVRVRHGPLKAAMLSVRPVRATLSRVGALMDDADRWTVPVEYRE